MNNAPPPKPGHLICIGTGMRMAGQITPLARSYLEHADVVVSAVPNAFTREWIRGIAKDFICVLDHYDDVKVDGKNRGDTYRRMADTILAQVRLGKTVCAAFYGHPGIFACIGHMAIKDARAEGYRAEMLPGVSALDCLVADLGIDPGRLGMQSYETTQFMIYQRRIDPTALLVLWQPHLAGELSLKRFESTQARIQVLVDKLARDYPLEHEVILYEAATTPFERTRIDRLPLRALAQAHLQGATTLVIPPLALPARDQAVVDLLNTLPEPPMPA